MNTINILFYSNRCEGSKQLISILQSEQLIRFFHIICTDNNPKIPPQITVTPTLIIRGVPMPYVAGDAFAWLAKVKQWKMNTTLQTVNTAQQQYLQNINNNLTTNNSNILGFTDAEMNGMSDMFSFFSKNISQECQDPLPQSFFAYNNIGQENIFTPPLENGTYKIDINNSVKIDPVKQTEMHDNLKLEREKQDNMFRQSIDKFINQYKLT